MSESTSNEFSLQKEIVTFIYGTIFFTVPYSFVWYLVKGGNFMKGYSTYLNIIVIVSLLISTISGLAATYIKSSGVTFKKKTALPTSYFVVAITITLIVTIATGIANGFQIGVLVFWPSAFFSMCAVESAHWIKYQFQNRNIK